MDTSIDTVEHLYEVLKDFDTAMVVTQTFEGRGHGRPMRLARLDQDGLMYFVASTGSEKVAEIIAGPVITVVFQGAKRFASLSGQASIVRDPVLIEELWSESWKIWFPKGKDDSEICLIEFDADQGEYWDNAGTQGLKFLFEVARAYATKQPASTDAKQHAEVSF